MQSGDSERFTLANRNHLAVFSVALLAMGAACPVCGHGTRVTSKRWAKCKQCGERVQRRSHDEVQALIAEAIRTPDSAVPATEETPNAER